MKKLLLLLCVPLIFTTCEKEEEIIIPPGWNFGGIGGNVQEEGYSVQQTTDGGYIITGTTEQVGTPDFPEDILPDVYLIKIDGSGIEQWTKTFGGTTSYDYGYSVQQTTDGGYIICGQTEGDVYLIKTDGSGIEQWSKTFGGADYEIGFSVQQTTDGGYIITGEIETDNGEPERVTDIYLIKTDGSGIEQWTKTFGGTTSYDSGKSVQLTTDGGYIICGKTEGDVCLIKTDGSGIEQWTKTFDGLIGYSVQQTTDGGYIHTGMAGSYDYISNADILDVYLIKTDENGIEQWSKTFGGAESDLGRSVQQTTDGGYIITGDTESYGNGGIDVYLIKTDANGIEQWSQTFGGTGQDQGFSVQQTTDGGYIITGETSSFGNLYNSDVYLIKTDVNGNVTSEFTIPVNANRKLEKAVDILDRDINPEKNKPFIEIYNDGTVEKKMIIE